VESQPRGYEIVRRFRDGKPESIARTGSLLMGDEQNGIIYRISPSR
jgi:hypothetical protein